jgi:hypothetical protein
MSLFTNLFLQEANQRSYAAYFAIKKVTVKGVNVKRNDMKNLSLPARGGF